MKWRILQKEVELPDDWRPWAILSPSEQLEILQFYNMSRLPPQSVRDRLLAPVLEAYMHSVSTPSMAVITTDDTSDPYAGKRETIYIPHKERLVDRGIRSDRRR